MEYEKEFLMEASKLGVKIFRIKKNIFEIISKQIKMSLEIFLFKHY